MRCLYCDRPLALLKRLTGDGEFCSKDHRKVYQQEHSQRALARLLEAQQGGGNGKARPGAPLAAKPEPPLPPPPPPVVVPGENQPKPAGYLPDKFVGIGASGAVQSVGLPRLWGGSPVWGTTATAKAGRPGPTPKAGVFVAEFPRPRAMDSALRRQDRPPILPLMRQLQLGDIRYATEAIPSSRPLSGAGFLVRQPVAGISLGTGRQTPADPRFGPLAQSTGVGAAPASWKVGPPGIRPAKFVPSLLSGLAAANQTRLPDGAPRWQPLDPALPQREPQKITLVLGSLLQRPVRPANHERIPEMFEIPLQPVSFPPWSPRMGCLEERLHRTDRIGFSPP